MGFARIAPATDWSIDCSICAAAISTVRPAQCTLAWIPEKMTVLVLVVRAVASAV